jgi:hypothetical protein
MQPATQDGHEPFDVDDRLRDPVREERHAYSEDAMFMGGLESGPVESAEVEALCLLKAPQANK